MSNTKVHLTYCVDNQDVANQLIQDLGRVGIEFVQDTRQPEKKTANENRMALDNAPIYMLVSDNFLKDVDCMEGALKFIDNFKFRPRIKPVVIDGRHKNEETGEYETTPTKFDKVSNVIRYMNYWQDEYLRLRREKRTVPYSEEAAFQARIDRIRRISNEIGEFLRSLRSFNYVSFETLQQNHFKRLFDSLGFEGERLYGQYSTLPEMPEMTVEEPETSTKSMLETLIDTSTDEVEDKIKVGDIPGMNQLFKEEKVEEIPTPEPMPEPIIEEDEDEDDEIDVEGATPVSEESEVAPSDENNAETPSEAYQSAETFVESMMDDDEDDAPEAEMPSVEIETPAIEVPEVVAEMPSVEIETPAIEVPEVVAEMPSVEIETPEVEVPELVAEMPSVEVETPEVEVPEVVAEMPSVEIETPEIEVPELVAEMPSVEIETPEVEVPEVVAEMPSVEIETPEVEVPEVVAETPEVEEEAPIIRTPQMILDEAQGYIDSGDYNAAKENYELLLMKSDDVSTRLAYAALLQDKMDNPAGAKEVLENIMLQDNATAEVYSRLGRMAVDNEDYLVAKNYYERAITVDGSSAQDYNRLGNLIYQKFENQDFVAKSYLQEAVNLAPEDADIRRDLAAYFIEKGSYKKARKQLLEAIDLDEDDAAAHMALASLYLNQLDKAKKARKYYVKATEIEEAYISDENDTAYGVVREEEVEEVPMSRGVEATPEETETEVLTVLITGATSGIGLATAETLAAQGHRLILTGRRGEKLSSLKEGFEEEYGIEVATLNFDVRDNDATVAALNSLSDDLKNVDVLINNAGLAKGFAPIQEGSLDHWNTMIDTNLKGLLYVSKVVAPWMVERKNGHIINIASIAGKEAYPNGAVYCATKAGVDQLTKGMRLDLYKHNIRVSSISPAHVEETEFAVVRFDGDVERAKIYNDFNPLTSADVAATIDFILSQPAHVCIQDVVISGTQQASATNINRSGRS